jgi:hypothetical protein
VFNHAILAIQLPDSLKDPSLVATLKHPKLGRILFLDPTNELTPFGQLSGYLQENYGLLIAPSGGELIQLPILPATMTGIQRMAKLTLDATCTLRGEVKEVRLGDQALWQRQVLHGTSQKSEWIKPIESVLSHSFANFQVLKASMTNLDQNELPFAWYVVDDLPPAADADYPFASYHSKTEVNGNVLLYTRSMEVKQLAVPLDKVADLKRLYQIINGDERNTAVLRPAVAK